MKKNTFSRKYLFRKILIISLCYGLGMFLFVYFFHRENYSFFENLVFTTFSMVIFFLILYLIHASYYLKKSEKLIYTTPNRELILSEEIVSYRKGIFSVAHGKIWRTSERVIFKSIKNFSLEIAIDDIEEEKHTKSIFSNILIIKNKNGKYHIFDIFS